MDSFILPSVAKKVVYFLAELPGKTRERGGKNSLREHRVRLRNATGEPPPPTLVYFGKSKKSVIRATDVARTGHALFVPL